MKNETLHLEDFFYSNFFVETDFKMKQKIRSRFLGSYSTNSDILSLTYMVCNFNRQIENLKLTLEFSDDWGPDSFVIEVYSQSKVKTFIFYFNEFRNALYSFLSHFV